jgi:hypothetical protein
MDKDFLTPRIRRINTFVLLDSIVFLISYWLFVNSRLAETPMMTYVKITVIMIFYFTFIVLVIDVVKLMRKKNARS